MHASLAVSLKRIARTEAAVRRLGREPSAVPRQRAIYHAALRRKYERAARYPWLPVPPDPPEPK